MSDLQHILLAYKTTPRRVTGETPLTLTHGFEAKVLVEVLELTQLILEYEDTPTSKASW